MQKTQQEQKKSPEEVAARRSSHLKEKLNLTDDQKTRVYNSMLTSISKKQAIREKYKDKPDKKNMRAEMKTVQESFDADMKTILTADQYTQWQGMKEKQKQKHKEKHKEKKARDPKAKGAKAKTSGQ